MQAQLYKFYVDTSEWDRKTNRGRDRNKDKIHRMAFHRDDDAVVKMKKGLSTKILEIRILPTTVTLAISSNFVSATCLPPVVYRDLMQF